MAGKHGGRGFLAGQTALSAACVVPMWLWDSTQNQLRWFLHGRVGAQVFGKSPTRCLNRCKNRQRVVPCSEDWETENRIQISYASRANRNLKDRLVL